MTKKPTVLFIYGTRPEAIKMAPLIKAFQKRPDRFVVRVCLTGQHRQMLDQINSFFGVTGDYDLNLMSPNQTLFDITARCLTGLGPVLEDAAPDLVFVQGDTTSVMSGALAAFYKKIPVAHLEAGLRSGDRYSPFPEEVNRVITGHIADWHFAPTPGAARNLAREGITRNVHVVGNTVIDALHLGLEIVRRDDSGIAAFFAFLDFSRRVILVTGHRRESIGTGFENIFGAIARVARAYPDTQFVYPLHFNPSVREPARAMLTGIDNVFLIEPLDYPYLIWLMEKSFFVLTDSGGIQEEAPALGKPVLVTRDVTERQEGVDAGTARLVGTNTERVAAAMRELLDDRAAYARMANAVNPYGDGATSEKIVEILFREMEGVACR
ncbi:MAG: UDP-N-acetylglucosamine 2-epimerase (non-hydrolyzing) [Treponematales bacterium]